MTSAYLTCYTLHRVVKRRDRLEVVLPCSPTVAIKILALYLENKALALPKIHQIPYHVLATELRIRRVPPSQVAAGLLGSSWLSFPSRLETWWMRRKVIKPHLEMEAVVSETVFEVFHLPGYQIPMEDDPKQLDAAGLILLRMHLWQPLENVTYLRLFLGWNDAPDPLALQQIVDLADDYLIRVRHLVGAVAEAAAEREPQSASPQAAGAAGDVLPEDVALDKASVSPVDSRVTDIGELPPNDIRDVADVELPAPERPRIYTRSLLKICRMAVIRQKAVDENRPIPGIEQVRRKHGPSYNTLLKAIDLVANWDERAFVWDVACWLKVHSDHTPSEITDRLNDLRTSMDAEDWSRVTGGS